MAKVADTLIAAKTHRLGKPTVPAGHHTSFSDRAALSGHHFLGSNRTTALAGSRDAALVGGQGRSGASLVGEALCVTVMAVVVVAISILAAVSARY